jgi:hypothetical protein
MNSTATARRPACSRLALIVAGIFALLGSFVVTAPAQAGYYDYRPYYRPYPCSYRCGYPTYRYYNGCSSCGCYRCGYRRSFVYERRYIEREYVERRYGNGGYRRYNGCSPYGGCYRPYGYYGGYRPNGYYGGYRPWGYGYGGIGRRWPAPYLDGYAQSGYEEPPRPPAPVGDEGDY